MLKIVKTSLLKTATTISLPKKTAILSPTMDFWLLGGASIFCWLIMVIAETFGKRSSVVGTHMMEVASAFALLTLIVNYPHFMISYKLSYSRGYQFILRNWFALIAVPLVLFGFILLALASFDGSERPLGMEILSAGYWLMLLSVGWHYSKQVFGVSIVYSKLDGYTLTGTQRNWLKAFLFAIAIQSFLYGAAKRHSNGDLFPGFSPTPLALPKNLAIAAEIAMYLVAGIAVWKVFIAKYLSEKRWPSINFLIAPLAFLVWWAPPINQKIFLFSMTPFFHSLQYLPFAYRMEQSESEKQKSPALALSLTVISILFAGFLFFEFIPEFLDKVLSSGAFPMAGFCMIAFNIFINIHHYFIDSVIWKLDQPQVQDALFNG